jgi:transcriptional regulator with GAF, ATPase, and Fis domain
MPAIEKHDSLDILRELTNRLGRRDYELLKKTHQLSVLVEIQKLLLQNNDNDLFQKIINMLSAIITADRIYIYRNAPSSVELLCEYHSSNTLSYTSLKSFKNYGELPVFNLYMQSRQPFHFKASDIPQPERKYFEVLNIYTLLRIPLYVDNEFWGFIGVDNCTTEELWEPEDVNVIMNVSVSSELYLKTKKIEEKLQKSGDDNAHTAGN